MIRIEDYRAGYGQSEVLHGLNFELGKSEIVAIVGRNGMGKTTLMKSLMGLVPPTGGQLTVDAVDVTRMKSFDRVIAGLGYVPQGRMIFPAMSVKENIETGLTSTGEKEIPSDLYTLFPVLNEMSDRRGGNLSGGQQQQLAIARALATKPKALLLDEPTEGIQPSIIRDMARVLKRIRDERQLSILVSEQVLSFAMDIADRVLVLENGQIVHEAHRDDINEKQVQAYLAV
ncbi:MAG: urea ABC transporter ATP-binding subunit UrtE [Granulosicoccus sp.]